MRGLTLYELIMASIQSGTKQPEDMVDLLEEADRCLQFEREGSFEFSIKKKIKLLLQYIWWRYLFMISTHLTLIVYWKCLLACYTLNCLSDTNIIKSFWQCYVLLYMSDPTFIIETEEVSEDRQISNRPNIPGVTPGAPLTHDVGVEEGDLEPSQKWAVRQVMQPYLRHDSCFIRINLEIIWI